MRTKLRNLNNREKICYLTILILVLIVGMFILPNKNLNQSSAINENKLMNNCDENLKNNDLDINENGFNITYNGRGEAWNITNKANRTDTDQAITGLENNKFDDSSKVDIFPNWIGYKLEANITDLYDERDWCNGTMAFGLDDGNPDAEPPPEDDSEGTYISNNPFQNWSFGSYDNSTLYDNDMSGNYEDNLGGHDCLELRMNGDDLGADTFGYTHGDKCWWSTEFDVPRGRVVDAELQFDADAREIIDFNSWELAFYVNNVRIWSIGVYTLEQYLNGFGGGWGSKPVQFKDWTDKDDVFPGNVNDAPVTLNVSLEYTSGTTWYRGFSDNDFQRLFIDNIKLKLKTEVKPSQVNLKINSTNEVHDLLGHWGKGYGTIENGNWNGSIYNYVKANFSSIGNGVFGGYKLDFITDLNLYAIKHTPESNYELNVGSIGTSFSVTNNSFVNWSSYTFVNVPIEYEQTEMIVNFPEDYIISHVGVSTQRNIDVKNSPYCDLSSQGTLRIQVSKLTNSPNGFWKFMAKSPNYCEKLNIFNNESGSWIQNSTFLSGHYIKIEANITKSPIIKDYIEDVDIRLQIRFPDGNLWTAEEQNKSPDTYGFVSFNPIKIPDISGSDYQAGVYQAVITMNNSIYDSNLNETGIIFHNFTVIHDSILKPDDDKYFIEGKYDNEKVLLILSFYDKEDNTAIVGATVFAKNYTDGTHYFLEPDIGSYQLEYDLRAARAGNNTLVIFAISNLYLNQSINITIEVTKFTRVSTDLLPNEIPEISFEQNITISFNYTELNSEKGISIIPLTDFASSKMNPEKYYYIKEIDIGQYIFIVNTSAYSAGKRIEFLIDLEEEFYELQIIRVKVDITYLGTIIEVFLDDNQIFEDERLTYQTGDIINITARYEDLRGENLNNANLSLSGFGNLTLHPNHNQFNFTLNSSELVINTNNILTIFANEDNYNSQVFEFIIEITKIMTDLNVVFSVDSISTDVTNIPLYEVAIGKQIEISTKYYIKDLNHITQANVSLGIDYEANLQEYPVLEVYKTFINTDYLGLGHKTISHSAEKENYVRQDLNLNVRVRKIYTEITTKDGEDKITIRPGEKYTLVIEVNDLDFDTEIEDCDVTYEWEFGDGDLKETEEGVYEVELDTELRPEGSYTITIAAFKEGGQYDFEDYEITLTIARSEGESLLFLILFLVAISGITALASYYVYYRKVLRYPKPVRKVRKFRRSLKKKKAPNIDIISREKAFKSIYSGFIGTNVIKGKTSTEIAESDKTVKKSLKSSIGVITKKPAEK